MDKPVFSTAGGDNRKQAKKKKNQKTKSYTQGKGPVKIRLEKKKRAGKVVTVCTDLPFDEENAKTLLKDLKASLGTGGAIKESAIEVQGDRSKDIAAFFKDKAISHKLC